MRTKPTAPSTAGERGTWQLCRSVSPRCGTAGLRPPCTRLLRPHNGLGSSVGSPIPWGIAGIPCTLPGPSRAGLEPRAAVGPAGPGHGGFLLAGEEWVPGERVAGSALHPGLVGASHRPHPCGTALPWVPSTPSPPPLPAKAAAGVDAAGTADCPRHLPDRHRSKTHPAQRAVQPLQRDLQPVLLQVQHQPRHLAPRRGQEQAPRRHHAPSQLGWVGRLPQGKPQGGEGFGGGRRDQKVPRGWCCGIRSPPPRTLCRFSCLLLIRRSQDLCYQVSAAGPVPSPPARGGWKGGWEGSGFTVHGKMLEEGWGRSCPHQSRGRGAAPSSSTAPVPGACSIWGCPTAPLFSRCLSVRR